MNFELYEEESCEKHLSLLSAHSLIILSGAVVIIRNPVREKSILYRALTANPFTTYFPLHVKHRQHSHEIGSGDCGKNISHSCKCMTRMCDKNQATFMLDIDARERRHQREIKGLLSNDVYSWGSSNSLKGYLGPRVLQGFAAM